MIIIELSLRTINCSLIAIDGSVLGLEKTSNQSSNQSIYTSLYRVRLPFVAWAWTTMVYIWTMHSASASWFSNADIDARNVLQHLQCTYIVCINTSLALTTGSVRVTTGIRTHAHIYWIS